MSSTVARFTRTLQGNSIHSMTIWMDATSQLVMLTPRDIELISA